MPASGKPRAHSGHGLFRAAVTFALHVRTIINLLTLYNTDFMKNTFVAAALLACCSSAAGMAYGNNARVEKAHKSEDADFMQKLRQDKVAQLGGMTDEERNAIDFLYRYMPLADLTDHTPGFYLDNVRASLLAKDEMPWGRTVPELLFRHFVLPLRVNNEALDSARVVFYRELKPRVERLTMKEAILEVNHWCHEKVTYRPSDARTSSPLATVQTAYGRCGEESTLLVSALRSIGIPARQVYTPRWAHTDDNHAWVEAWADGEWHFLGACEPEPVLDLGWFNAPASRAMLMHTRVFGDYDGPEEVLLRAPTYTEINLIGNYARTARIDFKVVDGKGKDVSGARVDFCIYNYAEYCPVVTKYTDAAGNLSLTAGRGDMMVWASKNGKFGLAKASFGKDSTLRITLDREVEKLAKRGVAWRDSFDIVPPPENPVLPCVSSEQRLENNRRFEYEDSLRNAYVATFFTMEKARKALDENRVVASAGQYDRLADFLVRSCGNHKNILSFIKKYAVGGKKTKRVIDLLATLSDKDLRDIRPAVLEDSYRAPSSQLSPRVENEMITSVFKIPFNAFFAQKQKETFRRDPRSIVRWINDNMKLNPDDKALLIAQTPLGACRAGVTDRRSRNILFVDMARSFDVRARIDAVTGKTQFWDNGEWADVNFDKVSTKASPQGMLRLEYEDNGVQDDPKYFSHFTISRINADGTTSLLDYPDSRTTWGNTFRNGISIDAGSYMLVTGTRLASGAVRSEAQIFTVEKGKETSVKMRLRTSPTDVSVIGSFNSEAKFLTLDGREVSFLSQTGRGYFITGLIGVGQEPTNHALKDIAKVAQVFERWGRPLVLLFEDEAAARKFNASEFPGLPGNIIYGIDKGGAVRKEISANMNLANESLSPIFFISDTFNRVVFIKQGYTISLGEQMEQVVRKLQ